MASLAWSKWVWEAYESDPGLALCSLAALGLWQKMLGIMARHDPPGYLAVNGQPLSDDDLARYVRADRETVATLRQELGRNRVYSVDRRQWIYCRRMVRDVQRMKLAVRNGKLGGNPSLGNSKRKAEGVNPRDNPPLKPRLSELTSDGRLIETESLAARASGDGSGNGAHRPPPGLIAGRLLGDGADGSDTVRGFRWARRETADWKLAFALKREGLDDEAAWALIERASDPSHKDFRNASRRCVEVSFRYRCGWYRPARLRIN